MAPHGSKRPSASGSKVLKAKPAASSKRVSAAAVSKKVAQAQPKEKRSKESSRGGHRRGSKAKQGGGSKGKEKQKRVEAEATSADAADEEAGEENPEEEWPRERDETVDPDSGKASKSQDKVSRLKGILKKKFTFNVPERVSKLPRFYEAVDDGDKD